jgi:hypothetical protein
VGVLYSVKQIDVVKNMKKNIVLDRLLELGVQESQQGKPIHTLSYEEMKYELVLAEFRKIDVETDANKWF